MGFDPFEPRIQRLHRAAPRSGEVHLTSERRGPHLDPRVPRFVMRSVSAKASCIFVPLECPWRWVKMGQNGSKPAMPPLRRIAVSP